MGSSALENAWFAYNAAVEKARLAMEATPRFKDRTDHRATAYYSLAEAQSMAYGVALATRMDHPIINTRSWYHNSHTLGGTSADLYHVSAAVDGRHTYRLFGRVGDMKVLVMQVFNTIMGGAGQKQLINVDLAKMADAKGNFEAILSAERHGGHWIPIDPKSDFNFLFIRRFFDDWYGDRGTLDIELLDGPIDNNDLDEAAMAARIVRAADILTFLVERWNIGVYDLYLSRNNGKKNSVVVVPGSEIASDTAGSPNTIYTWGVFDIQDDEALTCQENRKRFLVAADPGRMDQADQLSGPPERHQPEARRHRQRRHIPGDHLPQGSWCRQLARYRRPPGRHHRRARLSRGGDAAST
jgi:hypothetical protein